MYLIPTPSDAELVQPIALFTCGSEQVRVYWRKETRSVLLHSSFTNNWYMQPDMCIADSLAELFDWTVGEVETTNLFLFEGWQLRHGRQMPADMRACFLDCEWSDYACDGLIVSGTLQNSLCECLTPPRRTSRDELWGEERQN